MDTNNGNTGRKILALIGSSILTLVSLMTTGAAGAATQATANFVAYDSVAEGTWQGKYGSDGYSIANGAQNLPSYASFTTQNQLNWTWAPFTGDMRALQTGGSSGRTATTWYSPATFTLDVNLMDGQSHQVALYAVDWDARMRSETIQIVDANSGAQIDTRSISGFVNGIYLIWNINGHVKVNITCTGGSNAVVSGAFLGTGTPISTAIPSAVATFLNSDTTTLGSWQQKYGADGYSNASGPQSIPSYATFAPQNQYNWTWAASTSDPRALQTANGPAAASAWYNNPAFSFDVNIGDGKSHQFSVYALDWDCQGRSETVQIADANSGSVLDSRSIANFSDGMYLVWNITGHVKINVAVTSGPNAVISGVFFGGAISHPASSQATPPIITTQPSNQTVAAGQTATFSMANTGAAPITYQWSKNSVAISGATSSSYTTPATSVSDSGSQFSVMISNAGGSATSNAAVLTVNGTYILNSSSTGLSFGSVSISSNSQQSVTLTNTGTASVMISNVTLSGAGFNATGVPMGTILAPGQTASLNVSFAPAATGNATGSILIASNASKGATVITLSGSGTSAIHSVALSWSPSASSVVGYNVYVSTVSGSSYVKLTSSPVAAIGYTDAGLQTPQTRYYVVTSVDSNNDESAFSNEVSAIVP